MADESKKPKTDYGSNSAKSKMGASGASDRPQIKQITTGTVRKKSLGAKFKETFVGDSAESVGQYVLFDIIIPRAKDLIYDIIVGGSERSLFGTSTRASTSRRRSQLTDKTDYRGISNSSRRGERDRDERELSRRDRANHQFDEVTIPSRGEAEQILDTLLELVDQYDSATVADFYNATGISTDHTDLKFGWTDLSEARIVPARGGGYILDLPRVEVL
ncbi:hypothetical protein PBI_CAMILLE_43 [Microbacterium phage Camille]|nr:hypothetical protein PBI_CAMILLE_43 [Microbacterium phage Camille]